MSSGCKKCLQNSLVEHFNIAFFSFLEQQATTDIIYYRKLDFKHEILFQEVIKIVEGLFVTFKLGTLLHPVQSTNINWSR